MSNDQFDDIMCAIRENQPEPEQFTFRLGTRSE